VSCWKSAQCWKSFLRCKLESYRSDRSHWRDADLTTEEASVGNGVAPKIYSVCR
jgi:hypothetical protein